MIAHMLTHEPEKAVQLLRLAVDEGVREGARRGYKGCLCFQQCSDLRNVPLGQSQGAGSFPPQTMHSMSVPAG